ncbi:hypothetical protein [Croceicoccus bisphenolivorans]|uniref:hypothetical protein n=1 Tax=Croceicoccus bisphenolivorans TaxID=1783232 RepID=UPI00082B7651|nr:hypothetical protein [Croceicoccus bisphenolivorans]
MRYIHAVATFGCALIAAFPSTAIAAEETGNAGTDSASLIANARSAGPPSVSAEATVVNGAGNVLHEGSNGFVCHPISASTGPMCNDAQWEAMMGAMMAGKPFTPTTFGISYMLQGDRGAKGVSNIDPAAPEPTPDNDWVIEGPHLMLILPDAAMLEGVSTDPADPIYVMWKDTPYRHVMVRVAPAE